MVSADHCWGSCECWRGCGWADGGAAAAGVSPRSGPPSWSAVPREHAPAARQVPWGPSCCCCCCCCCSQLSGASRCGEAPKWCDAASAFFDSCTSCRMGRGLVRLSCLRVCLRGSFKWRAGRHIPIYSVGLLTRSGRTCFSAAVGIRRWQLSTNACRQLATALEIGISSAENSSRHRLRRHDCRAWYCCQHDWKKFARRIQTHLDHHCPLPASHRQSPTTM